MRLFKLGAQLCVLFGLCACAGPTTVISTDLTRVSGVYVIAYVDREDIRTRLEQRFVEELEQRGLRAVASQPDIASIKQASVRDMVQAANKHAVAAIIIVNRVAADGSGGVIRSDSRILPQDLPQDLAAYHQITSEEPDDYTRQEPVYAEANGFLVDGSRTRRFWTGTTWTLSGDDEVIISNVASTIAEELARVSREMRDYSRPM